MLASFDRLSDKRTMTLKITRLHALLVLLTVVLAAAPGCKKTSTPTDPGVTPTRFIELVGGLGLGNVLVGGSANGSFAIKNSGNSTLNVTGVTGPAGVTASFTGGAVAPGASQNVNITYSPASPGSLSGFVTVTGDQTGGSNTISVSASAFPNMNGTWNGTQVTTGSSLAGNCNMTWLVSGQTAVAFSGGWQTSGATCGQGGTFAGTASTGTAVTGVTFTVTLGANPCTRVAGDGVFSGTVSGTTVTLQSSDTVRCPGSADAARSVTISMSK